VPAPRCPLTRRWTAAALALGGALAAAPQTTSAEGADGERPRPLRPDIAIDLFTSEPEIATPIAIDVDSMGRVWAIESNTHFQDPGYKRHRTDRILIIEDTDGDGKSDRLSTFADGLEQSMALALERSGPRALTPAGAEGRALLVATRRDVRRLEDGDGDGRCDRTVFLAQLETREQYPHNGLSGFAFDDLGRVYFAIGENMGIPYVLTAADGSAVSGGPDGGSIFRMGAGGTGIERWAFGFWNTFHLTFDAFGRLFAVDNDPDSRPPCRLLHIVAGGDYGYRRWLGRKGLHPFTAWDGEIAGTLPMVAGTGEAPSGILACEDTGLPADLRGKLLVTSWGDYRIEAYELEERGASFRSRPVPIVQGGDTFRPVGIAAAPDGSVYITDWVDKEYHVHGKGRIWRLRAAGSSSPPSSGGPGPGARARYEALCALVRKGSLIDGDARAAGLDDPDPAIRAAAARLLGETAGIPDYILSSLASDPAPAVRLEAVRSLAARAAGGTPSDAVERAVSALAASDDPFLFEGAVAAMARWVEGSILAKARSPEPRLRLAALLALRRAGGARAAESLGAFLADPDPEVRRAAIQWAGEDRRKDLLSRVEEAFRKGPPSKALFEAWLAASSLIAGESPEGSDMTPRDDFLVAIARDGGRPVEVRAMALRAAPASHPGLGAAAFRKLLEERSASLRIEAVRSLRESAVPEAGAMLSRIAVDRAEPATIRREAVAGLSRFAAAHRPVLESLSADGDAAVRAEATRANRWADGATPAAAPASIDPASLLSGGDPAEGEVIFFHPRGPRCFACHAARGRGGPAGPDLSAAGNTPRAKLVESLLDPGKEVAPQYATWVIYTDEGAVTGVLLGEDAHGVLHVGDGTGEVRGIPAARVRGRTMSGTSIMPADLTRRLTADEIRDLIAFLEGMK
jgi:putative membrane-bound dehydrogenase-like protein